MSISDQDSVCNGVVVLWVWCTTGQVHCENGASAPDASLLFIRSGIKSTVNATPAMSISDPDSACFGVVGLRLGRSTARMGTLWRGVRSTSLGLESQGPRATPCHGQRR